MIRSTIRMTIPAAKREEVMKILGWVKELCRDEPGCLSCHIYADLREEEVLVLDQVWKTKESLDAHIRTEEYGNLLLALEMSRNKPEIRFDTISDSIGIAAIEKARSRARRRGGSER